MPGVATTCFMCDGEIDGAWSRFCTSCKGGARPITVVDEPIRTVSPREAPRRPPRLLGGFLGAVAVVIGSLGVNALFSDGPEARVAEYLAGSSQKEFFASDLQFRATFPTIPDRSTRNVHVGDMSVLQTFYMSGVYTVAAFDLPGDLPFDLNLAVNGAAAGAGGRVETSDLATIQGYEAVEFLLSVPEAGGDVRGLAVVAPRRVYILQVFGSDESRDEYDRFKDSFSITTIA